MQPIVIIAIIGIITLIAAIIFYSRGSSSPAPSIKRAKSKTKKKTKTTVEEEEPIDASATFDNRNILQLRAGVGGCLSIPDANNESEPTIQKCNASDSKQRWLYDANKSQLQNVLGSCLSARSDGSVVGWVCETNKKDQRWKYSGADGTFKNPSSETCLRTDSEENDSEITAVTCEREPNQRWIAKKVAFLGPLY